MSPRLALTALSIGAFGIGVTEFTPMGLLPVIAGDLGVSISPPARPVSAYAIGVLIGAPLMTLDDRARALPHAADRARRHLHARQPAGSGGGQLRRCCRPHGSSRHQSRRILRRGIGGGGRPQSRPSGASRSDRDDVHGADDRDDRRACCSLPGAGEAFGWRAVVPPRSRRSASVTMAALRLFVAGAAAAGWMPIWARSCACSAAARCSFALALTMVGFQRDVHRVHLYRADPARRRPSPRPSR